MLKELYLLYKQNQGDKTARYLLDWLHRVWEGRWDKFPLFKKYFERRMKMLDQLLSIYPDLKIQGEDFEGNHTVEVSAQEYRFLIKYAPIIHYKKLPNEIVIEIDNPSKGELMKVLQRLKSLEIEPLVCWSGSKSWHIHIITFPKDVEDFVSYAIAEGVKEFTDALYKIILRETKIDGLDVGVQLYKSHWIRSPYSLNVKNGKIGLKKPLNGDLYKVWFFEKRLAVLAMMEIELGRKKAESRKISVRPVKVKKYEWIQKVIEHPEIVKDGRERLLWLAIVPYLVLQGYSDSQIEDICQKWVEKSGEDWKSKYRCKVRSMIKHCRDHERKTGQRWMPIRFDNLLKIFPDLEYLKKELDEVLR